MNKNTQTVLFVKIHLLRQNNAMQNNSKQLNAWYEVEVEEGGTKMFVFNYFLLCTRGQAVAAGNTQSSRWKCTEQHSRMINTHLQRSHHEWIRWRMQNTHSQMINILISDLQRCTQHDTTQHINSLRWAATSSYAKISVRFSFLRPHELSSISRWKNTKLHTSCCCKILIYTYF